MIDRLSDASSQMTFTEVARGKAVTKSELNSDDGVYPPHPSVLQFTGNSKISTVFVDWNEKIENIPPQNHSRTAVKWNEYIILIYSVRF